MTQFNSETVQVEDLEPGDVYVGQVTGKTYIVDEIYGETAEFRADGESREYLKRHVQEGLNAETIKPKS